MVEDLKMIVNVSVYQCSVSVSMVHVFSNSSVL